MDLVVTALQSVQSFVARVVSNFLSGAPVELLYYSVLPFLAAGFTGGWLYLRRRGRLAAQMASRILKRKAVGVSIEVHRFAHDQDREFEGSIFTKLSTMFFPWNDADHTNVVSVWRSETKVRASDISHVRKYIDHHRQDLSAADVEVFGWHARGGAVGVVIVLDRSGDGEGRLETFSFGNPESDAIFEARVYDAVSRSVALKHKSNTWRNWSIPALRGARSSAARLSVAAEMAGQQVVLAEAKALENAIRSDIADCSIDVEELLNIASEMKEEIGDWRDFFDKGNDVVEYSRLLFKISYLCSDPSPLDSLRRKIHQALALKSASKAPLPRSLFLAYLITCSALSPLVGDMHGDLEPIDARYQFREDIEIAAWLVCSRSKMHELFISRPGYYPLMSIKAAIECLPPFAASVFLDHLSMFYQGEIRREGGKDRIQVMARACQLLPFGDNRLTVALNRATRCVAFSFLAQEARIFGHSPEEFQGQVDRELLRLVDEVSLQQLDFTTLYGFVIFDHIFNSLVHSSSISPGLKKQAMGRIDDFVSARGVFKGLAKNSISGLISALNNASTMTGDISYAKRALDLLSTKQLPPGFHTTYLRSYALVECVELATDAERGEFLRKAQIELLRLRRADFASPTESGRRHVESLSKKLEAALATSN